MLRRIKAIFVPYPRKYRQRVTGFSGCRTPAATARIAAQAGSSRARSRLPPWCPFASFALPAGSETVRASAIALRSKSDGRGVTLPSAQARRKARTSAAAVLKPHPPRLERALDGMRARSRASRNSASRQRSATTRTGRPKRSSAAPSSAGTSVARCPSVSSSPRLAHIPGRAPPPHPAARVRRATGGTGTPPDTRARQSPASTPRPPIAPRSCRGRSPRRTGRRAPLCPRSRPTIGRRAARTTAVSAVPRLSRSASNAAKSEASRRAWVASARIAASKSGRWSRLGFARFHVRFQKGGSPNRAA